MMKKLLSIGLLLFLIMGLFGCQEKPEDPIDPIEPELPEYSIVFQSLGGSLVDPITVVENETATKPTNPTRSQAVFRYWYENDQNIPFDFTEPITKDVTLRALWSEPDVVIGQSKTVNFQNLTTEFDVANGTLDLFFPENGNVPYVKVTDYFELLRGFIDPEVEFTITEDEDKLVIYYEYYDEDEDETYELECIIDVEKNLITTNDPGFYWAYIYSTETNYGRNIEYLYDYELNESIEGEDVIYNLNPYYLDLAFYDGSVVAPYYLVNQLFAGSSYYNVYYNGDALYGVYGQISPSDIEYSKIRRSSYNDTTLPSDLLLHSYNVLAFNMDNFYGLKDYKEITSFYEILTPYRTDLLSPKYDVVSQAIADFLLLTLDEPHTSYGFSTYYAPTRYNPPTNSLANYGERFNAWYMDGLYGVDDVIKARWNITPTTGWAADSPQRPKYWLIDKNSAVITFDSFVTSDIEETVEWNDEAYKTIFEEENILPILAGGNRYFVYNQSDDKNDISETLIWGLTSESINDYATELINNGWEFIDDSAETYNDYHDDGYYTKEINGKAYMVNLSYNGLYETAYIGLTTTIPATYELAWKIQANIVDLIDSDSAIYLETMIKELTAEFPNVKNIGIDLTFNTGGNVGALYRILGLITDQPFGVSSFSRDNYSYSTSYVTTSYDSYTEYDWFLLTSFATFSAANEMATIFKQNNIGIIIGETSGGGASSITPVLLPDGTFFTMSSNNVNCYKDSEGNYIINEDGIEPHFVIDQMDLYNNEVLADILNGQ